MSPSVAQALTVGKHKSLAMRGEGLRRLAGSPQTAQTIGHAIDRALAIADIPKQSAAYTMGYADASTLSRWITGAEDARLSKLWELGPRFQQALLFTLGERCESPSVHARAMLTFDDFAFARRAS